MLFVGDLLAGEERHVVVRFGFPPGAPRARRAVRSRVVWMSEVGERRTAWQEVAFTYAGHAACDAEQHDPTVMHWVGLHMSQSEALVAESAFDPKRKAEVIELLARNAPPARRTGSKGPKAASRR